MDTTFETLTRVAAEEMSEGFGRHRIVFDEPTAIWTVNGGYLGAALLRCAGEVSQLGHPASLSLQFLRAVKLGEAHIETRRLAKGSTAELLEGRVIQNGNTCVIGHVWTHERRPSPELRHAVMPPAPHPDELRTLEEMRAGKDPRGPFWDAFEERQINVADTGQRRFSLPRSLRWVRCRGVADDVSPFVRAGMVLPIIDLMGMWAADNGYRSNVLVSIAPTIQLTTHFYELDHLKGWFLSDTHAENIGDGLINIRAQIWSLEGALVAQGLTQMAYKAGGGAYVAKEAAATQPEPSVAEAN